MRGEDKHVVFFYVNCYYQIEADGYNNKDLHKLHDQYKEEASSRYMKGNKIKPNFDQKKSNNKNGKEQKTL